MNKKDKVNSKEREAGLNQTIFGLGCFWWVQSYFDDVEWVIETEVWYAGWEDEDATYDSIWDHSEVVKIIYDEDQIIFDDLVKLFIEKRNPTFPPYKRQYDSLILFWNNEEEIVAKNILTNEWLKHKEPINIRVEPKWLYYKAEEFHQKYNEKAWNLYSCS